MFDGKSNLKTLPANMLENENENTKIIISINYISMIHMIRSSDHNILDRL